MGKILERRSERLYLSVPHMGGRELDYVKEAFESNWLSTVGPNLNRLEADFQKRMGVPGVALASGTAGIHLGLRLLGVGEGDEVVIPSLTFVASVNPVMYQGAKPVFIDSERASWNLDPNLLADFLKKRADRGNLPKVILPVHLFGQCTDMDPVLELCRRYGVKVLEDAAEALGTTYRGKPAGALGDVGVFSFNGNKIITGTSGGMLVSSNEEWVKKVRFWSTQARDPGVNYLHSELGYNYRLSNVLAGIVRGQLEVLDDRVAKRRAVAFAYRDAFSDLEGFDLMPQADFGLHTNWLSVFLIDEKKLGVSQEELIASLEAFNVESRPVWKPMHTQKLYEGFECIGGAVAEDLNRRGICLPSSSSLTDEEQEFVIAAVRRRILGLT